jgi:hypothetical protein
VPHRIPDILMPFNWILPLLQQRIDPKEASNATKEYGAKPSNGPRMRLSNSQRREGLHRQLAEVNAMQRFHAGLRFVSFTVFIAAIGGIASKAFASNSTFTLLAFRVAGLAVTSVFYVYELRIQFAIAYDVGYLKRIEEALGYDYYRARPEWIPGGSSAVTRSVFQLLIVMWLVSLLLLFVELPLPFGR